MTDEEAEAELRKLIEREMGYRTFEPLLIKRLRERLTASEIVFALDTIGHICPSCWDADNSCQCGNDE